MDLNPIIKVSLRRRVACAVMFATTFSVAQASPPTKQIAAPPEEIVSGTVALPDPARTGMHSTKALIPIDLLGEDLGADGFEYDIHPSHAGSTHVALLVPELDRWAVEWGGTADPLTRTAAVKLLGDSRADAASTGGMTVPYRAWSLSNPKSPVRLSVRADADELVEKAQAGRGFLLISPQSTHRLYSHLATHELVAGREIGIRAWLYNASRSSGRTVTVADAEPVLYAQASVTVRKPSGERVHVVMHDDSVNGDQQAAGGVLYATLHADVPGRYLAHVEVEGTTPDGEHLIRTNEHLIEVVESLIELGTHANALQQGGTLHVQIEARAQQTAGRVQARAEVWGTRADGTIVPVAWIGGIVEPQNGDSGSFISLSVDARWFARARAGAPLLLRNVRVQDVETRIPTSLQSQMPLTLAGPLDLPADFDGTIAPDMLHGALPRTPATSQRARDESQNTQPPTAGVVGTLHRLMLVHGYCSGGVWPESDFSDDFTFLDANQSRAHDEFAQLIAAHGNNNVKSFGVVAHSQGGAASLHLYTYYWSGLDWATGPRLIQSVGTPYQGTALAGDLALLGEIFGAGCGTNFDMTYDGASLWLAGIPGWARSKVYYWTTSFEDGFFVDYCNILTDLFLSDPDDGVVEQWAGQLPGANNMGHKEGWCHTTGMSDPAQYLDHARNAEMNANAAR